MCVNVNKCAPAQKNEELRVSLERIDKRSSKSGGTSAREDRSVPVPGPFAGLRRCDSASSMGSVDTVESTTASISGRKRPIKGDDSSSSGLKIMEVDEPKKPRRRKSSQDKELDTQDSYSGYHNIRDATGKFAIDSRETRRNLKKLESRRAAERAALDKSVQLPTRRLSKSRVLRQKMMDEMVDQPMDDLTTIGEETEMVEKLAYSANNLNGTTQKALYEAAARINAVTSILGSRVQSVPEGDALEELRGDLEALRKENVELRAEFKSAKADIKKLRERNTVRIQDSPKRKGRKATRRRINSDSESEEDDMQVDEVEGGGDGQPGGGRYLSAPSASSRCGCIDARVQAPTKGCRHLKSGRRIPGSASVASAGPTRRG